MLLKLIEPLDLKTLYTRLLFMWARVLKRGVGILPERLFLTIPALLQDNKEFPDEMVPGVVMQVVSKLLALYLQCQAFLCTDSVTDSHFFCLKGSKQRKRSALFSREVKINVIFGMSRQGLNVTVTTSLQVSRECPEPSPAMGEEGKCVLIRGKLWDSIKEFFSLAP